MLDAARVEGRGRLRRAQEVGLTLIVLGTLRDWLRDESAGQERSKARLGRRLRRGGQLLACCGRGGHERREPGPAGATPEPPASSVPPETPL